MLGIVNGTTNFILTRMEAGADYAQALAEAQRLGYAEADPSDDVSGADAAAKMAILATVAFGVRVGLEDVLYEGIEHVRPEHVEAARELDMTSASSAPPPWSTAASTCASRPAFVDRHHPLAAVEGAFNAVMLQGDAIREITLEGPGAGGIETASAVVADIVSVVGTAGTGFLQNDAAWRTLPRLPAGDLRSRVLRPHRGRGPAGVLAHVAEQLAAQGVSVARLAQRQIDDGASLDLVTHEAPSGRVEAALATVAELPEVRGTPTLCG